MYVINQPGNWEDYIHLVEFACSNNYQASLQMSLFEVLYGRRCKVPLSRGNLDDRLALGPDMLAKMEEIVQQIKQNLKIAQDKKKFMQTRREQLKSIM